MNLTTWPFALFVLCVLVVYYLVPPRLQNRWLLAASYFFYLTWTWFFPVVLSVLTVATYVVGRRCKGSRRWLLSGIAIQVGMLAVLKYAPPLLVPSAPASVLLPIGLSFQILHGISYLVDVHRGQMAGDGDPWDFALYLAYFPKLLAGPIERARAFVPQLQRARVVDDAAVSRAFTLIVVGLVRKVVIADGLSQLIPARAFEDPLSPEVRGLSLVTTLLAYAFLLLNDFAGYTSLARGVSLLFGIELSPNFQLPYLARNFTEFWNRWHITLSAWLRDYVYFPLSRALLRRNPNGRYLPNIVLPPMVAMLASGLWHDASLHMLTWGALHGAFQAFERVRASRGPVVPPDKWPLTRQWRARLVVFSLVTLTWLPFRTGLRESASFLWGMILALAHPGPSRIEFPVYLLIALALALDAVQHRAQDELVFLRWPSVGRVAALAAALLAIALASLGVSARTFVYQEF